MLVYYRLPGVVADLALIYYALVVLAIFRLIPVTLTLAGIAGFVLSVGMAVDANILIFERTKEELRLGKTLNAAIEAGFNRAWNSILDSNVSSLITAGILYCFGSPTIKGFALVLIIGVLTSMFTAVTVSRTILRVVVHQDCARRADLCGVTEEEFLARTGRSGPGARRAPVFDVIGKRRWFFLFSGLITIPGLIFILLTPITERPARPPVLDRLHRRHDLGDQVRRPERRTATRSRRRWPKLGVADATVIATSGGFYEIRSRQVALPTVTGPDASPSAARPHRPAHPPRRRRRHRRQRRPRPSPAPSTVASASPARLARREPPHRRRAPRRLPAAGASAAPGGLARLRRPVAAPRPSRRRVASASWRPALQADLGPIEAQRGLSTVGPVISQELTQQADPPDHPRLDRHPASG